MMQVSLADRLHNILQGSSNLDLPILKLLTCKFQSNTSYHCPNPSHSLPRLHTIDQVHILRFRPPTLMMVDPLAVAAAILLPRERGERSEIHGMHQKSHRNLRDFPAIPNKLKVGHIGDSRPML